MKKIIALLLVSLMVCVPNISYCAPADIIFDIINREHSTNSSRAMELLYSFKKSAKANKDNKEPKDVKIIKNEKELNEANLQKGKIQGTLIGIDVSKWDGNINWKQVKGAGIRFAVIRAGYGYTKDKKFKRNIEGAIKNDIYIGIYWFSYAYTVDMAVKEAKVCADIIKPYKNEIDLPVYFDYEYDSVDYAHKRGKSITKVLTTNMADAFCSTITSYGYEAGIYTNLDFSNNYFRKSMLEKWQIWIAQWTRTNTYKKTDYSMWQYGARGYVKGIKGYVDMDYFYGDKYEKKN